MDDTTISETLHFLRLSAKRTPTITGKVREMSICEIITAITAALVALSSIVEVSKIKINPWSALFKWIGNKMMADTKEEIKELSKKQEELAKKQEELKRQRAIDAADVIKAEIFSFYNECQKGQRHSEGEFNHIIKQNKKYEKLIEETGEENGVYEMEYKYILAIYEKCQKEKDFL